MSRSPEQCTFGEIIDQPRRQAQLEGEQYTGMLKALKTFGISLTGVPTFAVVKKGLTPEVLGKVLKLQEPTLSLTPPLTRQQMIKTIDSQKGRSKFIREKTYVYEPGNDELWSEGQAEEHLQWEVNIEEGKQDLPFDEKIYWTGKPGHSRSRTNHEQVKLLIQQYTAQGLEVMSGTRRYLALMMKGLAGGKPIDQDSWTLINPQMVSKDQNALLGAGHWRKVQVFLFNNYLSNSYRDLRVRASVRVLF